jgi:hypothetical protein
MTLSDPRATDSLADLARILEGSSVDYALIGGHAVHVWLDPRFTADINLTLQAGVAAMTRLKARAGGGRIHFDHRAWRHPRIGP